MNINKVLVTLYLSDCIDEKIILNTFKIKTYTNERQFSLKKKTNN